MAGASGAGGSVAGAGGLLAGRGGSGGANAGTAGAAAGAAGAPVDHSLPGAIVVLGSSTSAGTGPKDPKNAWVPRYQAYLAKEFPQFKLVNLAVGGYTTFEIQPTDYKPPPNRKNPVKDHNITAALALKPDAIIVNMPSNDQANNFPVSEQMANYERVAALASAQHVSLWVSTSQPRNFDNTAQLDSLKQARDQITQRFSPRVLDFWNPFAQADGRVKPEYGAGDGIHLNDAAHAILAQKVIDARVPEAVLSRVSN